MYIIFGTPPKGHHRPAGGCRKFAERLAAFPTTPPHKNSDPSHTFVKNKKTNTDIQQKNKNKYGNSEKKTNNQKEKFNLRTSTASYAEGDDRGQVE
jgi:hypothetical protein